MEKVPMLQRMFKIHQSVQYGHINSAILEWLDTYKGCLKSSPIDERSLMKAFSKVTGEKLSQLIYSNSNILIIEGYKSYMDNTIVRRLYIIDIQTPKVNIYKIL